MDPSYDDLWTTSSEGLVYNPLVENPRDIEGRLKQDHMKLPSTPALSVKGFVLHNILERNLEEENEDLPEGS